MTCRGESAPVAAQSVFLGARYDPELGRSYVVCRRCGEREYSLVAGSSSGGPFCMKCAKKEEDEHGVK